MKWCKGRAGVLYAGRVQVSSLYGTGLQFSDEETQHKHKRTTLNQRLLVLWAIWEKLQFLFNKVHILAIKVIEDRILE